MTLTLVTLAVALTACSSTYEARKAYLDGSAANGAAMHHTLKGQGTDPTRARCGEVYGAVHNGVPYMAEEDDTEALEVQGERLFLDSCVSGQAAVGPASATPSTGPVSIPPTSPTPFPSSASS